MQRQVFSCFGGLSIVGLTLAIGILGGSGRAIAEDGCPEGYQPYQNGNMSAVGCMQIPNYGNNNNDNNAPSRPRPVRLKTTIGWASLAHAPGSHIYGVGGAEEFLSKKSQAENAALSECQAKGGTGCTILMTASNNECILFTEGVDKITGKNEFAAFRYQNDYGLKLSDEKDLAAKFSKVDWQAKYVCAKNQVTERKRGLFGR